MLLLAFSSSDTYQVLTFDVMHYFYLEKPVWTQIRYLKEYFSRLRSLYHAEFVHVTTLHYKVPHWP